MGCEGREMSRHRYHTQVYLKTGRGFTFTALSRCFDRLLPFSHAFISFVPVLGAVPSLEWFGPVRAYKYVELRALQSEERKGERESKKEK